MFLFLYIGAHVQKRGETKGIGPLGSCEPELLVSGRQLPSICLLIFRVVTSCGEPVPYSYINQKPGLEYIFFSWAAAVSGWFFGQLQGWLTDTIVNHARGCETGFWNRLRVKLPVNCLCCFVLQDAIFFPFFFFLSPI